MRVEHELRVEAERAFKKSAVAAAAAKVGKTIAGSNADSAEVANKVFEQ